MTWLRPLYRRPWPALVALGCLWIAAAAARWGQLAEADGFLFMSWCGFGTAAFTGSRWRRRCAPGAG